MNFSTLRIQVAETALELRVFTAAELFAAICHLPNTPEEKLKAVGLVLDSNLVLRNADCYHVWAPVSSPYQKK